MAQPIWITPPGHLGTIAQGVFYEVPLIAYEPTHDPIYFELVAGDLPQGIACNSNGIIAGVPTNTPIGFNHESKFAIRVYTKKTVNGISVIDRLADRTFTITVTGQPAPEFITPPGLIAQYYDGSLVTTTLPNGSVVRGLQIKFTEYDYSYIRLVSGTLPPGTTISPKGLINGFLDLNSNPNAKAGFSRDGQGYSEYPFDFTNQSSDSVYEFTLEVSNGTRTNLRSFVIQVYSRNSMTADNSQLTSDNTFITADVSPSRPPILLTPPGSIGTVYNDNYFAFHFDAIDLDGSNFQYALGIGPGVGYGEIYDETGVGFDQGAQDIPPGLTLDPNTGWLYGYIPNLGLTTHVYNFSVLVFQTDEPDINSGYVSYSLTVVGDIDTQITWLTPSDLGYIDNGATSTLYVKAVSVAGIPLYYQLLSGSNSLLPQGLKLMPSGDIVGRVSFNTFAIDGGATTFDVGPIHGVPQPTIFDMTFNFIVNVYSLDGFINFNKEFTIHLVRRYNEPFENLYIQAMPPVQNRTVISNLLLNTKIFPVDLIYRPDDLNFGVAKNVVYWHAYGLTSSTYEKYISALYENHYWKDLTLGSIETARALDDDGNVIYEVVYSRIIDNLINNDGESVSKAVVLPYPVDTGDSSETLVVYPNALEDMRTQVIDTVGQLSKMLPRWMLSVQANGQVLGFTPAWVIAYTQPGKSGQIAYNISTQFGGNLNQIDFEVDRYELDRLLSIHWNPITKHWFPTPAETTFDVNGWSVDLNYLGEVDYGTFQAFFDLQWRNLSYINSIGGIDGVIVGNINNKKLIFINQETYYDPPNAIIPGPLTLDQAWTDYTETFDDSAGYDASLQGLDQSYVIPGQAQSQLDPLIPNERMGIYRIHVDSGNVVTLELIENTTTYDYVTVMSGRSFNETPMYVPGSPGPDLQLINWQPVPESTTTPTIFDGGSMRFIDPVDMYDPTDEYNKYLVFPHKTILG